MISLVKLCSSVVIYHRQVSHSVVYGLGIILLIQNCLVSFNLQ